MSNKQPEHPTSTPTKNGSRKNPKKEPVVDSRWENGQVSYDFCVARSILTCISNTIGCEIKFGGVTIPPKSDHLRLSKDDDDIKMLHSISMAYAQSFFDNTTDTETNGSNNKVWFDNVTGISHSDNGTNSLFTDFRMIMGASILHKVNISIYEHETQTMVPVCPYDESYNYDSELILTIWKRPIGTTIDLRWTPGFIDIHRVLFSVDTNPFTPLPQDIEFVRKIIDSLNQDINPDIDNHFAGAFAIIPLHVLKMPKVLELVLGRILPKLLEIMQKEEYDGPNKMTKDMLNELLVASVGNDFDYSLLVDDNDIVEEVVEKKLNKLNQYGIYLQASNATIGDRRNQFEEQLQLHDDDNTFTILDKHMKSWLGYTNDDNDQAPVLSAAAMKTPPEELAAAAASKTSPVLSAAAMKTPPGELAAAAASKTSASDTQIYIGMAANQTIWKRWGQEANPRKMDGAKLLWQFTRVFGMGYRLVVAQVDEGSTRQGLFFEGLILGLLEYTVRASCPDFKLISKYQGVGLNQINGGFPGFVRRGGGGVSHLVDWFICNSNDFGDYSVVNCLDVPASVINYLTYWESDVFDFVTGKMSNSPASLKWAKVVSIGSIEDITVSMLHSFLSMHGGQAVVTDHMLEARVLVVDTSIDGGNPQKLYDCIDKIFGKWTVSDGSSPSEKLIMLRFDRLFKHISREKYDFIWPIHEQIKAAKLAAAKEVIHKDCEGMKKKLAEGMSNLAKMNAKMNG